MSGSGRVVSLSRHGRLPGCQASMFKHAHNAFFRLSNSCNISGDTDILVLAKSDDLFDLVLEVSFTLLRRKGCLYFRSPVVLRIVRGILSKRVVIVSGCSWLSVAHYNEY